MSTKEINNKVLLQHLSNLISISWQLDVYEHPEWDEDVAAALKYITDNYDKKYIEENLPEISWLI